jgi:hypothetical protein
MIREPGDLPDRSLTFMEKRRVIPGGVDFIGVIRQQSLFIFRKRLFTDW